jgi:hypothetical protein
MQHFSPPSPPAQGQPGQPGHTEIEMVDDYCLGDYYDDDEEQESLPWWDELLWVLQMWIARLFSAETEEWLRQWVLWLLDVATAKITVRQWLLQGLVEFIVYIWLVVAVR